MLQKVLGIGIIVLLVGALIGGTAYIITRGDSGEAYAAQNEQGRNARLDSTEESRGSGGQGSRQSSSSRESQSKDWLSVSGTVVESAEGLLLQTGEGLVEVELGQERYVEAQGVRFAAGDEVRISGFYEGEVFIAGTVENLSTGQTLALRDEAGQPLWAGQGGGGQGQAGSGSGGEGSRGGQSQASSGTGGEGSRNSQGGANQGQAQTVSSQGQGYRGGTGAAPGSTLPEAADPEALEKDWQTVSGTVVETAEGLLLQTGEGLVEVELGQERYVEAQGVGFAAGDEVRVSGFYEGEVFTAGTVENLSTGQTLVLRDEAGRPLWAGRGGQGAGRSW